MKRHSVETFAIEGLTVRILHDTDPESPREWSNLGTMVCWHRGYSLGDKHEFSTPHDFLAWAREQEQARTADRIVIRLPLYLYDHSGLSISTGAFSCPWDSGQVGWIYITRGKMLEEYAPKGKRITKALITQVTEYLRAEVQTYDQYLTGDVYGFEVLDSHGDQLDSCWGFFGMDDVREEATQVAAYELRRREQARADARELRDDS